MLPMQELHPLGLARGTRGLQKAEGRLLLPVVVVLQPGDHPYTDCKHGDACKDRSQAGIWSHTGALGNPWTSPSSLDPKPMCLGPGGVREVTFPLPQVLKGAH